MASKDHRLLYATPTGKHPTIEFCMSFRSMELTCKTFARAAADQVFTTGPVQMARSGIARQVVADNYDFVVMHDDDLMVDSTGANGNPLDEWHEIFENLPDVGVIGAVYLRERPNVPTVVMAHPEFPEEQCHIVCGMPYRPFPVAGLGTGFMMVRRQVFDDLADGDADMFRFSSRVTRWGGHSAMGEDYDFCQRARAKGWRVLADPRFSTLHVKSTPLRFDWHDWEAAWKDEAEGLKGRAGKLREHVGNGPLFRETESGLVIIDHTPALIAGAAARAPQKAA